VLAVVAGLVASVAVVGGVEALSSRLYPLPAGLDYADRTAMAAAIGQLPTGAFVAVLAAWGLGALVGSFTAARVGGRAGLGYLIGALLGVAAAANLLMVPHPVWMWVGAAIVIPAGTMVGVRQTAVRSRSAA
jgi:hypothetical protein